MLISGTEKLERMRDGRAILHRRRCQRSIGWSFTSWSGTWSGRKFAGPHMLYEHFYADNSLIDCW